jgi:hypothetical protein
MARAGAKTPAQQLFVLRQLPVTTVATVKIGRLRWEGRLQPTVRSDVYIVRIDYAIPRLPEVTIVAPQLEIPSGGTLPHTYPGERLCLCYPGQWNRTMLIAKTIVPWTSEWLLHYEIWKITWDWHGGGHEPASAPKSGPEEQVEDSSRSKRSSQHDPLRSAA